MILFFKAEIHQNAEDSLPCIDLFDFQINDLHYKPCSLDLTVFDFEKESYIWNFNIVTLPFPLSCFMAKF